MRPRPLIMRGPPEKRPPPKPTKKTKNSLHLIEIVDIAKNEGPCGLAPFDSRRSELRDFFSYHVTWRSGKREPGARLVRYIFRTFSPDESLVGQFHLGAGTIMRATRSHTGPGGNTSGGEARERTRQERAWGDTVAAVTTKKMRNRAQTATKNNTGRGRDPNPAKGRRHKDTKKTNTANCNIIIPYFAPLLYGNAHRPAILLIQLRR